MTSNKKISYLCGVIAVLCIALAGLCFRLHSVIAAGISQAPEYRDTVKPKIVTLQGKDRLIHDTITKWLPAKFKEKRDTVTLWAYDSTWSNVEGLSRGFGDTGSRWSIQRAVGLRIIRSVQDSAALASCMRSGIIKDSIFYWSSLQTEGLKRENKDLRVARARDSATCKREIAASNNRYWTWKTLAIGEALMLLFHFIR